MTNLPSKRGFSSISGDGFAKNKENESGNSAFAKKICLQVENLVKEMSGKGKSEVDGSEKISSLLQNKQCRGALPSSGRENVVSVVSKAKDKSNEMPDLGVTIAHNFMEHGDALRDNCLSSVSIRMCSKKDIDGERVGSDTTGDDVGDEELVAKQVCNDKDVGAGRLVSSKFGSIEWSRLPKSQGSRSFELERCSVLKDDGCANLSAGSDLLKDCSCSFCSKAIKFRKIMGMDAQFCGGKVAIAHWDEVAVFLNPVVNVFNFCIFKLRTLAYGNPFASRPLPSHI
ncbi:dna-directed rna polymerase subunit beta [Citrus sinensis]|uniref:Dna-directed rna polymerase subunit beta n=1 Tax=Citrus sinensis TaxID=2711 RepID=A0ACB8JLB3_CITSI|nr:dna-directed rna polymerase subunit beta [Citrus sinensis]